jgi:hypothetical protein
MTQSSPPTLVYASPDGGPRRWSKSAIVSILIPVLAVPASIVLVDVLSPPISWQRAGGIAAAAQGVACLAGMTVALATLVRVLRESRCDKMTKLVPEKA